MNCLITLTHPHLATSHHICATSFKQGLCMSPSRMKKYLHMREPLRGTISHFSPIYLSIPLNSRANLARHSSTPFCRWITLSIAPPVRVIHAPLPSIFELVCAHTGPTSRFGWRSQPASCL